MGGFLALNDDRLADEANNLLTLTEGFPTYGGCAARDLEALAVGLREVLEESYLEYRHATVRYLSDGLRRAGIPTCAPRRARGVHRCRAPPAAHPARPLPGQSLACALYLAGGIRSCEIGSVMFGTSRRDGRFTPARLELVRLAVPRRVYTQSHVDRVLRSARKSRSAPPRSAGSR